MTKHTRRRSPRWLVLWLLGLLIGFTGFGVILVVGGAIWVNSPQFKHNLARLVEAQTERVTGEVAYVGSASLSLSPFGLEVKGLRVVRATNGSDIFTVSELYAPLTLHDLRPKVGILTLVEPKLSMMFDDEWKADAFQNWQTSTQSSTDLPFNGVVIKSGEGQIQWPQGGITLKEINILAGENDKHSLRTEMSITHKEWSTSSAIEAPGLHFDHSGILLSPFSFELASASVNMSGSLSQTGDKKLFLSLNSDLKELPTEFHSYEKLFGSLDVDYEYSASGTSSSSLANILVKDLFAKKKADSPRSLSIPAMTATMTIDGQGLALHAARASLDKGSVTFSGHINPDATVNDLFINFEEVAMDEFFKRVGAAYEPIVSFEMDAELNLSGTVSPIELSGPTDMVLSDFSLEDRDTFDSNSISRLSIGKAHLIGESSYTWRTVRFDIEAFSTLKNRGKLSAEVDVREKTLDLNAHLYHADFSELRPLGGADLLGRGSIKAQIVGPLSDLKFSGKGQISDFWVTGVHYADHFTADLTTDRFKSIGLSNLQADLGDTHYTGEVEVGFRDGISLHTDIEIERGFIRDLTGMFVDIEGVNGEVTGNLKLDGPIYDMDGVATLKLGASEIYGERFTSGSAHGYMDAGIFTLDHLRIRRGDGTQGFSARGSIGRGYKMNLDVVGSGFNLSTMDVLKQADLPLSGSIALTGQVAGTLQDPSPRGRLTIIDMQYADTPVKPSYATFQTNDGVTTFDGVLVGESVVVAGEIGLWEDQPYRVDASFADFPIHTFYPVAADGNPVTGTVSGTMGMFGNIGPDPSPVDLDLVLSDVLLSWQYHSLKNSAPWSYSQRGSRYSLENFDLEGQRSQIQFTAEGDDSQVSISGRGDLDMDLLRVVVPGLTQADGRAEIDLSVSGPKGHTDAVVDISLSGSMVRHSSFPEPLEELNAKITGTAQDYTIKSIAATLGGGQLTGSGSLTAEQWLPTRFDLSAVAQNAQVQWVDYLPPAIGNGEITFNGPVDGLLLSGDITIDEMAFIDRIDWEDWVVEWQEGLLVSEAVTDEIPLFSIDMALTADSTILLRNNVADGTASADLRIIGDTNRPGLVGWVRVDEGEMLLQDRNFIIDRGELDFRDPWSWDPDLSFEMVTDITDNDQLYRVTYQITGPFSDWTTSTYSDPGLPQADINALLWFGTTIDNLENMGEFSQALTQGVADIILADLLVSTQVGNFRDDLPFFVDRIEIVTGVNSRGEYSSEPRLLINTRFKDLGGLQLTSELNFVRSDDQYIRLDQELSGVYSLSGWYATHQRERQLPLGGAFGLDLKAQWETD